MAFPQNPNIGQQYTTPSGSTYEFKLPGVWINISSFPTFIGLNDTPASYSGANGYALIVNPAGDGIDFVPFPQQGGVQTVDSTDSYIIVDNSDAENPRLSLNPNIPTAISDLQSDLSTVQTELLNKLDVGSTTDVIPEGSNNLYYTDSRASAAAPIQSINNGSDITVTNNGSGDYIINYTGSASNTAVWGGIAGDITNQPEYGVAGGFATLDSSGKIPSSQLNVEAVEYLGSWDPVTNTPLITNGVGDNGDMYQVSQTGTADLGDGSKVYEEGSWIIYNGSTGKWDNNASSSAVTSVFGRTGPVVAQSGDYNINQITGAGNLASLNTVGTNEIDDQAVTNSKLANVLGETFKGRFDSSIGEPQDMTPAQARSILNVDNGANNYVHPNHTGEVTSSGDGATALGVSSISNKPIVLSLDGTESILLNQGGTLKKTTVQEVKDFVGDTKPTLSKTFTLESPTSSDDITIFRTDVAITVQQVVCVSTGTSPSTTFQLRHAVDRSVAGNQLTFSSTTTSGTTTGDVVGLGDATIPADSWVWFETTAASGTDVILSIDIRYTED